MSQNRWQLIPNNTVVSCSKKNNVNKRCYLKSTAPRSYFEGTPPPLPVSYLPLATLTQYVRLHSPSLWSWFSSPLASSWRRCTGPELRRRTGRRRWRWPLLQPSPRPSCPWRSAAPPNQPPSGESRAVLPSVRERLPTGACTQPKILYAAREHSLCGNFVFGGRINSEAENNLTLLLRHYTFTVKWTETWHELLSGNKSSIDQKPDLYVT